MDSLDKIAVLIPCWNEAITIGKVIRDFRKVLPEAVIYVYDNNSTDRTAEIAEREGNMLVRRFINMFWGENSHEIKDVMTGYRAFSPMFVKTFPILSKGFEIETEMTIHALDKNLLLANVPVSYRDRPAGSVSKLHTFRDGARVLRTIFMLYKDYRPLRFFTMAALAMAFISLALFLPVFHEYMVTGLVPKLPTLVTSGFCMMAAVVFLGTGLMLDIEVKNSRKNFEIQMNIIRMMLRKGQ